MISPVHSSRVAPKAPPTAPPNAFIVMLNSRPDLAAAEAMPRGPERKKWVFERVAEHARTTQAPAIAVAEQLQRERVISSYSTLVSPNALVVTPRAFKAGRAMNAFAQLGATIYDNAKGFQQVPEPPKVVDRGDGEGPRLDVLSRKSVPAPTERISWALDAINAPAAWAQGATGAGMVYGVIDTGVDASHEALRHAYRGARPDGTFDNDYNWADFDFGETAPTDNHWGHGTHVTGAVVGKSNYSTIGVAPEAKFIGVRGLGGSVDGALRSLQWMLAPTKIGGSDPDATKAPDVVGMSWTIGRNTEALFRDSVRNLQAAGIEVVKSAGNRGPDAGTITSPGQFPGVLATASIDKDGNIANTSSRGPVPGVDGEAPPLKPDFAAPGVAITSSVTNNRYAEMSGTSMAQPHLSGAVLALLSKYPQLNHNQLVLALSAGATDAGAAGDDATFGRGIINLKRSLDAAQRILGLNRKTAA